MSKQRPIPLDFEGEQLEGVFVVRRDDEPRPTVVLFPTVMGVSDLEIGFARQLAELGFNGFVADAYAAIRGESPDGLPTFDDGVRAAQLTEAVLIAADEQRWVDTPAL